MKLIFSLKKPLKKLAIYVHDENIFNKIILIFHQKKKIFQCKFNSKKISITYYKHYMHGGRLNTTKAKWNVPITIT